MRLYLVMGETGEYEDRHSWPVKGYLNERLAKHHARRAGERAYQLICEALNIPLTSDQNVIDSAKKDYDKWNEMVEHGEDVNEWDNNFHSFESRRVSYYVAGREIYLDSTSPDDE